MKKFEALIYQVATDAEFRHQMQANGVLVEGLSQEETAALDTLRDLLRLSTEEIQKLFSQGELRQGWFPASPEQPKD